MNWKINYLPDAVKDLSALDGSQKKMVMKAIIKVSQNPSPNTEGGYGKPLSNRNGNNLCGFNKIKLKVAGLRVVYQIMMTEQEMLIVVIGIRSDDEVYAIANQRTKKLQ